MSSNELAYSRISETQKGDIIHHYNRARSASHSIRWSVSYASYKALGVPFRGRTTKGMQDAYASALTVLVHFHVIDISDPFDDAHKTCYLCNDDHERHIAGLLACSICESCVCAAHIFNSVTTTPTCLSCQSVVDAVGANSDLL